jgi:hypothetical protein
MSAPKNYSVKRMIDASDTIEIEKLMRDRFAHLTEKKARRAARELVALRKFHKRIESAAHYELPRTIAAPVRDIMQSWINRSEGLK